MGRGHDHAGDAIGAEGVDREQGHERRVDPARERQPDMTEAVLRDVVAKAEDERAVDLGEIGERLGDPARSGGVEVADEELLLELSRPGDHRAAGVEDEALAVEDQLVLAADEVAEGELGPVASSHGAEELLALAALAAVVRGSRGVGDQRRPFGHLGRGGRALDPAVLADGEAHPRPGDVHGSRLGAGDEVALLVEDRVVGQADLAVDGAHRAVGEHGERVVGVAEVAAAGRRLGEPDQGDDALDAGRDLLDGEPVGLDEMALQVEVLGRVARHAELREDDEAGLLGAGATDPLGDLRRVGVDVADGRVDLGQGYAHWRLSRLTFEVSPPGRPERARPICRLAWK